MKIDFETFMQSANTPKFWGQGDTIVFKGDTFPPLLFSAFFTLLEKKNLLPYQKTKIDLHGYDKKILTGILNQSILGQYSFFWFGSVESINQQDIHTLLATYQGPHIISYFIPLDSKHIELHTKSNIIIDLPSKIDYALFNQLLKFLDQQVSPQKNTLIKKIFNEAKTLDLDTACMLTNYLELIPTKSSPEIDSYLAYITNTQPTLSQLSEHFFAKNAAPFWKVWAKISDEYQEMFWLAFWSEQIWKAYHVVKFLKKNDFVNAKKMSFRLPYSFLGQHWKKHSTTELTNLYEELYTIDRAIKKGSTFFSLDLFYLNYFLGKIKAAE